MFVLGGLYRYITIEVQKVVMVLAVVYAIVAHTDMDGVAAGALYVYLNNVEEYRVFFTEPFLLHKALGKVSSAYYERVVILDIGINSRVYEAVLDYIKLLREHEIPISWYDHHVWSNEWINTLRNLGVNLYLDQATCTVGVVAKYTKPLRENVDTNFVESLVRGVCAGDMWKFDHWLGGFYVRLVRRKDKDAWRKEVLKTLAKGVLWAESFEKKVEEHMDRELMLLSKGVGVLAKNVNGLKLAVARSLEDVENSFVAAYVMGRYDADVVVIASPDGRLSFRSRNYDVGKLAYLLGGGGHKYAAGAKVEFPWWLRFLSKLRKDAFLHYVLYLVSQKLKLAEPGQ
mgnify:CR=1 FL=1